MTTTDKAITKKVNKTEAMERIAAAVSTLAAMSGGLPEINEPLAEIFKLSRAMVKMIEKRDELLEQASALIDSTQAANKELTRQRDAIATEMQGLIDDLKAGDFFSDALRTPGEIGVKGEIYQAAVEQHNAAFWESLPYDMADVLGESWMHMDAHALYSLITDDEEIVAEGYDLTPNEVLEFRQRLLDMVRELTDRDRYPDED